MDPNKLCPGCMKELTSEEHIQTCPHCGYQFDAVSEGQAHRLRPHTVLNGKYVIGKVLGEGGFGITYLGYDLTLEMKIAIKEYYPAGYATREVQNGDTVTAFTGKSAEFYQTGKDKFIREARALAKFSNLPGIVSVRDFFEANNTSYIIMEYLEGNTLKHYLRSVGGRLPLKRVLDMMEPVIRSLEEVHKQGLIHRDISPDNIMILNNGDMKLLDFGAAREVAGPEADKSLSVMLKPGYAPEEQYRTHGKQGPWTDLYAICGTIYKCLTGTTPIEAMERMRNDTLVPPSRLGVLLPPWQEGALMKGMALYAEDRYHSLEDFYRAFYLNQNSGLNDTNDGRTVAMTGNMIANQASSAWGGRMNQQDNQFGGQPNGVQYDPATGMPVNQANMQNPQQPQPNGNPFVQNGPQAGPYTMNGAPNAQPNPQAGQYTMNGAPNLQKNDPFTQNGPQAGPYTMNGTPNMQQNDPFTQNVTQNLQMNDPFTQNTQQNGPFTQNGPYTMNGNGTSNDPFTMNGNNFAGPQYAYGGQMPDQNTQKKNKVKLGVIIGVIAVIIIAIVGIVVALVLNKKDDNEPVIDTTVTEIPAEVTAEPDPTQEPTEEPEEPTQAPVIGDSEFTGDSSAVIRGNGLGTFYSDHVILKTEYGICAVARQSDGTYDGMFWLAALNSGIEVKSMAVYQDYLYMACGETGLVRTSLETGDDIPVIVPEDITSFAIVDDRIFYIVLDDIYDSYGELYMCDLDGSNSQLIEYDVTCQFLQHGSADFEYVNGAVYYVDGDGNLKKMNSDGSGVEVAAEASKYDNAYINGVYYHGGKIYSVGYGVIYAYDVASGAVEKVADAELSTYFPLVFAGDALLYCDGDWVWHSVIGGQDTVYDSDFNNEYLYMTTIEDELFYFADYNEYYSVDYEGGTVIAENLIDINYYETPDLDNVTSASENAGADYRAAFTGYTDSSMSYLLLKNNQWEDNTLIYTDTEKYYALVTDKKVRYFTVIGNEVYYSTYDSDTETFAFWRQLLAEGSTPELLLDGTQVCAFSYYNGLIYFDNYDDYYELYSYDPNTEAVKKIDNASLNYYYILDDYVYFECLDDGGMYKMSLDGADKEFLFYLSDYNIEHLDCLTAFSVDRSVYLAFTSTDGYMYITTEDGSAYEEITSGLDDFDLNQDIYYSDGSLYYSDNNGTEIHKLDIAEYLQTDVSTIPDTVISRDSFIFFEVNNGLIYIELYDGNNEIKVIDYQTGEEYNTFDFS